MTSWLAPALALAAAALAVAGVAELLAARPRRSRSTKGRPWVGALIAGGSSVRAVRRLAPPADLRARVAAAGAPSGLGAREVTPPVSPPPVSPPVDGGGAGAGTVAFTGRSAGASDPSSPTATIRYSWVSPGDTSVSR